MKLSQLLLVENNLDQFRNAEFGAHVIGQTEGATELQVQQVKQALRRHKLAVGERPEGSYWESDQMAWEGDDSGVWTTELSQAVRLWKESIQKQIRGASRARSIRVNEVINNMEDLFYLVDAQLIPENEQGAGFLRIVQGRVIEEISRMGARIDYADEIVVRDVNQINSLSDMINAIGYNGWIAIVTPILNQRFPPPRNNQRVARERDQLIQLLNVTTGNLSDWYNRFKTRVLSGVGRNFQVEVNGERVRLLPDLSLTRKAFPYRHLYLHFVEIASALIEQGAALDAEREVERSEEEAGRLQNDPTMDATQYTAAARQLYYAFENDLVAAVLPGGRDYNSDTDVIEDVFMTKIRAAVDYDNIAEAYQNLDETPADADLGADLVDNLDDQEYERIVRIRLKFVRRIAPRILHMRINFNGEENISVNYDGSSFLVGAEIFNDRVQIEPETKDCILEDAILRQAVVDSGNEIPDLFVSMNNISADIKLQAANLFIQAIEETYPELVPWYTNQEPFNSVAFNLGGARLGEIMETISLLLNSGTPAENLLQRTIELLQGDRLWLVGDGEDLEGNANITFDGRYRNEGLGGRNMEITPEQTELDDADRDLITRMADDREDIARAAIEELGANADTQGYWQDKIYRGFRQEMGKYPDLFYTENDNDILENYLLQGEAPDGLFGNLLDAFGEDEIAIVAPSLIAKLFEESMEGGSWVERNITGGTYEELMSACIDTILNRDVYIWVNEFYGGSLYRDVIDEDNWGDDFKERFAARIGESFARDEELGLPERVRESYQTIVDALINGEEVTQEMFDTYRDNHEEWGATAYEGRLVDMRSYWRETMLIINENIEEVYGDDDNEWPSTISELYDYNQTWFERMRDGGFRPNESN